VLLNSVGWVMGVGEVAGAIVQSLCRDVLQTVERWGGSGRWYRVGYT
jgi:hypothetical protein